MTSSLATLPAVRVDNHVPGWTANVRTSYASLLCGSGDFKIGFGDFHVEKRGYCLLTQITAQMFNGNDTVRAWPYTSFPGTTYSHFEIVEGNQKGFFCVRRVGTQCAG